MEKSTKKYNLLLFIFLQLLLFSLITTQEIKEIVFDGNEKTENCTSYDTSLKIDIKFLSPQIKNYIKIHLTNPANKSYILSVFSDQSFQKRIQMDQSLFGTPKVWVKKSQIETERIHAKVECEEAPCNFTIKIEVQDFVTLNAGEQMNYYVTEENEEIEFSFKVNSLENNLTMNIWAESGLEFRTELKNVIKAEKYNNFKNYYVFKLEDQSDNTFRLNVNGIRGDFINVGSSLYLNGYATKNITVDENRVKVFLRGGILETACFRMELKGAKNFFVFGSGIIDSNVVKAYQTINGSAV